MTMEHRHEYGPCCEHAESIMARLEGLEWMIAMLAPPVEEEAVVIEELPPPTEEGAGEETPPVDVDIDVHVEVEGGEGGEGGEEPSSEEESSSEEEGGEGDEGEVVIHEEAGAGLPELTTEEHKEDSTHRLPMMRS